MEKNVPIALILPGRWQEGAECLEMELTSCLWKYVFCWWRLDLGYVPL